MTITEAIQKRKSIRGFDGKPLSVCKFNALEWVEKQ
jgi:hypothetical protein